MSFKLLVFLVILSIFSITSEAITLDLIHRDSPFSPFYDNSVTHYDRQKAACNRSESRRQLFINNSFKSKRSIRSHVISYEFELLMKVNVGTPSVTLFLVADTGSDLIWIKSLPCTNCANKGRYVTYNPKISGSYRPISCKSSACVSAYPGAPAASCGANNSCPFSLLYGDGSRSLGDLGFETMGLGSNVLPNVTFGFSHILAGSFPGSGIVGLGAGPLSLVRQLGNSIGGARFSYCLGNDKSIGKISFGDKSIPMGPNVVSTPIVFIKPDTFYYLTINSFSIGANGKKIKYGVDGEKGNIIIDSGTTLTFLPVDIYKEIRKSYTEQIKGEIIPDPSKTLDFCYKTNNVDNFPPLNVHFDGGSDLVLPAKSAFISLDEGVFCLTVFPFDQNSGSVSIYGNLWQENTVVGYDLDKKQVHFKQGGCPKY